jgi:hypothetical protein
LVEEEEENGVKAKVISGTYKTFGAKSFGTVRMTKSSQPKECN